eukprot:145560_1
MQDALQAIYKFLDETLYILLENYFPFPKIIKLICDYVKYIQYDAYYVDCYEFQSKYDNAYYCDILSYVMTPCMLILDIDEHGDMSKGILQDAFPSTLLIVCTDEQDQHHPYVLHADSISYMKYNIKYNLKGKISYYLSPKIMQKLKNSKEFRIYFQYGICPNSGYKAEIIIESTKK